MDRVNYEEDQLVIKDIFKLFFGRTTKIPYEKIERIDFRRVSMFSFT